MSFVRENWKPISLTVITTLITSVVILFFDTISYQLYFKNQFDVDVSFSTPLFTTKVKKNEIQEVIFAFTPDWGSEDTSNRSFSDGDESANLFRDSKAIISNKNKLNNLTLNAVKMNFDFEQLISYLPKNPDKAYEAELLFLRTIYDFFGYVSKLRKMTETPYSITGKYNNGYFEFLKNKIDDLDLDNDFKKALPIIRDKYIYYSNRNNYQRSGDAIKFIKDSSLFKKINDNFHVNYIYFMTEYPVEIKVGETKVIELPRIISKLINFSKDKKIVFCFTGEQCKEVIPPKSFIRPIKPDSFWESFSAEGGLSKSIQKKIEQGFHNKSNEQFEDWYSEKELNKIFYPEFREIKANLKSQYFKNKFSVEEQIQFFRVLTFLNDRFQKSLPSYKIKNKKIKDEVVKKFKLLGKSIRKAPPHIWASYASDLQIYLIGKSFPDDDLSQKDKDQNQEVMKKLDTIISFINSRGDVGLALMDVPELEGLVLKK